jgi:hypothetical protein
MAERSPFRDWLDGGTIVSVLSKSEFASVNGQFSAVAGRQNGVADADNTPRSRSGSRPETAKRSPSSGCFDGDLMVGGLSKSDSRG